jgi:3-isopropylmalate dehydratase small subunit
VSHAFSWVFRGRAWTFGDDIGVDGDLMPLEFALRRETDPHVLKHHLFAGIDPDLARRMQPGDIVVAGHRFAQGNPHIQGLLGLAGAGLGLIVRSIPSGSYRNAVNAGLPLLLDTDGATSAIRTGESLVCDFSTGALVRLGSGDTHRLAPLPAPLRHIVECGGWRSRFRARLAERYGKSSPDL